MRNEEIPGDKNSSFQRFRKRFMISLAGSVITREKRSANDLQKIDCDDAIKKAGNKYVDLSWKVKGGGDNIERTNERNKDGRICFSPFVSLC